MSKIYFQQGSYAIILQLMMLFLVASNAQALEGWKCTCICGSNSPRVWTHNTATGSKFYIIEEDSDGARVGKNECPTAVDGDQCSGQKSATDNTPINGEYDKCSWKYWPKGTLPSRGAADLSSLQTKRTNQHKLLQQ